MSFSARKSGIDHEMLYRASVLAEESLRSNPLVTDPCAAHLAGAESLAASTAPAESATAIALSTAVVDELVYTAVMDHRLHAVVHLGAGLDTRPFRIDVPSDLRWVELDRNDVLLYKSLRLAHVAPACRIERVAVELLDSGACRAALVRACLGIARGLFLTENARGQFSAERLIEAARHLPRGLKWWVLAEHRGASNQQNLLARICESRWEVADCRRLDREARRRLATALPGSEGPAGSVWLLRRLRGQ